jgi:hypothetical protein
MNELFKMAGIEMPSYLGKVAEEKPAELKEKKEEKEEKKEPAKSKEKK